MTGVALGLIVGSTSDLAEMDPHATARGHHGWAHDRCCCFCDTDHRSSASSQSDLQSNERAFDWWRGLGELFNRELPAEHADYRDGTLWAESSLTGDRRCGSGQLHVRHP